MSSFVRIPFALLALASLAAAAVLALPASGTVRRVGGAPTAPYPGAVLSDGPVAYWRLGEASGAIAADSSSSAVAATYVNGPTLAAAGALSGDADTAITLKGADFVEAPISTQINPAATLTVEAWAKITGASGHHRALVVSRSADNFSGYALFADGRNRWGFALGTGTTVWWGGVSGPGVTLGKWTYLVGTFDGTTIRLYVDGALVASGGPLSYNANTTRTTRIGMAAADTGTSWAMIGSLDEVAVYPTALSGTRIAAHYAAATAAGVPVNTAPPAISGAALVGQTLTVSDGTWTGWPSSYARQWKRCDPTGYGCTAIAGATTTAYTLGSADAGLTVSAEVTAANAAGSAVATAAATAVVLAPPANTAPPAITGPATVGAELAASTGTWSGSPTSYAYQWERCTDAGAGCTAIATATGASYVAAPADSGSTLRVSVTATNAAGSATAASAVTTVVTTPPSAYVPVILADSPLGYWRFEESTGSSAADASGNGRSGTYMGSPALAQVGALAEGDRAAAFNGTSQYVNVPYDAALNPTSALSVEVWVKVTGGQGTLRSIVTSRDFTHHSTGYSIYATAANTWQFTAGVGGSNMWVYTAGGTVALDQWTHIVATYSQWPGDYRLYVNGKLAAVTTSKYLMQPNTLWPLRIGAGKTESPAPAYYSPAVIDEVAVYGNALTPAQVAAHYASGTGVPAPPAPPPAANPIQAENQLPGTGSWKRQPTAAVEGYASAVSALPGDTVNLHVSAHGVRYRIDLYRLGWYSGLGGRLVSCSPSCTSDRAGTQYPVPSPDPVTGLVAAGWPVTDSVTIPADVPSGIYLAQLVVTSGADAGKASVVPVVVREPIGWHAAALVQVPVNTWQAYNGWGGKSLYAANSTGGVPAVKVSFDRPYSTTGTPMWRWGRYTDSPNVFDWEIQLYRFLEREGVDISYQTNFDTTTAPASLLDRKLLIDAGHDEYWSKDEMDAWYAARDQGVNLAFFGGGIAYWQSRYEDSGRTLVEYRIPGSDPIADQTQATYLFSYLGRPDCALIGTGSQYGVATDHRSYTVVAAALSDPWLANTGFVAGDTIPDGVGYEWQGIIPGCQPEPLTTFFHYNSSVNGGFTFGPADVTRYTAPSSALVFAASSLQFSWALDDYLTGRPADSRVQQFVRNILADMLK